VDSQRAAFNVDDVCFCLAAVIWNALEQTTAPSTGRRKPWERTTSRKYRTEWMVLKTGCLLFGRWATFGH